jgi:pilus assembly protein Flp/PilA
MKNKLMNISVRMQTLLMSEEGQDLIEYALVVALIAFSATAGMSTLATKINNAFGGIGSTLSSYIS